jgi:hypothetical protein
MKAKQAGKIEHRKREGDELYEWFLPADDPPDSPEVPVVSQVSRDSKVTLHCQKAEDGLEAYPDSHFAMGVCSLPYYGIKEYGDGSIFGDAEKQTFEEYLEMAAAIFLKAKARLADRGTQWVVIGEKIDGKDCWHVPARLAMRFAERWVD